MSTIICYKFKKGITHHEKILTLTLAVLLCLSVFVGFNPQKTPEDSNILEPPKNVIDNYDNKNEIEVEIGGDNENNEGNKKTITTKQTY